MEKLFRKENNAALRWLVEKTGRSGVYILLLIPLQAMLSASFVLFPLLLKELVDYAATHDWDGFLHSVFLLVALVAGRTALLAVCRFLWEWSKSTIENDIRGQVFGTLLRKDYTSVTAIHSGEWMNRLTSDVSTVANGMVDILPDLISTLVSLFCAAGAIIMLEPLFAAVLLPVGCVILLITYGFRKILKRMYKEMRDADGKVRVFLQERLSSLMIVRTFGMERTTDEELRSKMEQHKRLRIRRNHFANLCYTGFGAASYVGYLCCAVYCGYGIFAGAMTFGTMTAMLSLVDQVQSPFASLTGFVPQYYSMIASAERLMEVDNFPDDCEQQISQSEIERYYSEDFNQIGLDHVSFTYQPPVENEDTSMPVVLRDISISIAKGEYVALTGHSGCGKSTVLKLLMGIYPIDSGICCLSGKSGTQELTSAWRGLFAYVPQGNQLMSGTIREIVAFGDRAKMQQNERIWHALRVACADEFVAALPDGLDTVMGERGSGLSEGQTQRIAIARAVFSERSILLLDESTSALDDETEQKLLVNLQSMTDKTVLIVTHRPAVLEICHKQIMMDESGIQMISSANEQL